MIKFNGKHQIKSHISDSSIFHWRKKLCNSSKKKKKTSLDSRKIRNK